jgi:pimeloyl-ACP methyl ester carboxylesterase
MRGEGLSDPVAPRHWQTVEQRAEDLLSVLDAVGAKRPALLDGASGGHIMIFFAVANLERASALVLFGSTASTYKGKPLSSARRPSNTTSGRVPEVDVSSRRDLHHLLPR